jgi:hypothetical protein
MISGVAAWPRSVSKSAYQARPRVHIVRRDLGQWAEALLAVGSAVSHPVGGILVGPDKPGGVHIGRGVCSPGRFDGARGKTENKTENESRDGPNPQVQSIGWYLSLAEGPFGRRRPAVVIHLSASTSNEVTGKPSQAQIFHRTRIYGRIDARRNLSLGEVHLDTALVGPRNAFAKRNRRQLICIPNWGQRRGPVDNLSRIWRGP